MTRIFVSHPGLQHSHQLALALHERGLLQAYWSGVPVLSEGQKSPFWLPYTFASKIKSVSIPPALRRHPMAFQALLRASAFLPNYFSRDDYSHRIFHAYDRWAAQYISRMKPDIVVAYENSAYHTFRSAKAVGARCILDAPSLHHATAAHFMEFNQTPYLGEINRRKDMEVELADLVLTCSPLAAESYVEHGTPSGKVRAMLLGATLPTGLAEWEEHSRPLHFIFAGTLMHRKSIDIILQVFCRLNDEGLDYQLSFVGGIGETGWVEAINRTPHARHLGGMSQVAMYQFLAQADCLLLPSRYDSFGMVVAEAFACGTPAIVSSRTGAKAMIEQYPKSGWVVSPVVDSLYLCVKARIQNRAELFDARTTALEASRDFTWHAYRERVGLFIEGWAKQ